MARFDIVYHPVSGNLNGHIAESVLPELKNGKKIDFLVCGKDPGSKRHMAEKLGIKIIDEDEFKNILKHGGWS